VTERAAKDDSLAAVFGRAAPTYDTIIPFFATFGSFLVDLADPKPGERVLDVASGRGASLFPAAERVGPSGEVLGVDLAEPMVDALRADIERRAVSNASVQHMDAMALDLPDAGFDVVLCGFSLWLFPDPEVAASEFRRVLRAGGRCAVSKPTGAASLWAFLLPLAASFAPRATTPFPPLPDRDADQAAILSRAGFEIVEDVERSASFMLGDAEAWWRWVWSAGLRSFLELLPEDALAELKAEAFLRLVQHETPDGIPLHQRARFVVAEAPD